MEGVENTANNASKEVKGFVQHIFKFDNDTQADMTNAAQYLALMLIPLGISYNFINSVIPKTDESKGNIELLIEVFGQTSMLLLSIFVLDRIITYIPTISGRDHDSLTEHSYRMVIIGLGIIALAPKNREKLTLIYNRLMEAWNGKSDKENMAKKSKVKQNNGIVSVSQPITGIPQTKPTHGQQTPDYLGQHNQMQPPLPQATTQPQQLQQQPGIQQQESFQPMQNIPMAANEGFGAFSSF